MRTLTGTERLRLYEALGNIAEGLPAERRIDLVKVARQRAWGIPDTDRHRHLRAVLRKHMSDLVVDDWRWALAVLPDEGGADTLWRWATDAGHVRSSSS